MNVINKFIYEYLRISPEYQSKIFESLIIFAILFILRRILLKFFVEKFDDAPQRYQWRKLSKTIAATIGAVLIARVWFGFLQEIGTFLGLVSAGLAIAFRDLLVNIGGWLFIMIRRPFRVGDRIEINSVIGDVIDTRMFQFSLMEIGNWVDGDQATGRIIHMPNQRVFDSWQANYTTAFKYIWNEIAIMVTFESDWKKTKTLLLDIANQYSVHPSSEAQREIKNAAGKYMITNQNIDPVVYTTVKDSGVNFILRYFCRNDQRRLTETKIWEDVLAAFAQHKDIDFAYPTQRFYNNAMEGKEEARIDLRTVPGLRKDKGSDELTGKGE